jgi:hypothetical protein
MIKKFNEFIAENYVGMNAESTKKRVRKHRMALEMEKRGMDSQQIRTATGWFRNEFDEKWRYEHNTAIIKFKQPLVLLDKMQKGYENNQYGVAIKLHDLIENTSLFKEYPKLKNITVNLFNEPCKKDAATAGFYRGGQYPSISIFNVECDKMFRVLQLIERLPHLPKWYEGEELKETQSKYNTQIAELKENPNELIYFSVDIKGVLLHEIQHAIQREEGFESGGDSTDFQPKTLDNGTVLTPHDQYRLLAGEIEARDVENRMLLPKEDVYIVYRVLGGMNLNPTNKPVARFKTEEEAKQYIENSDDDSLRYQHIPSRKTMKPYSAETYDKDQVIKRLDNNDKKV